MSPSLREQKIIVSLCVTSVWISTWAQILLLPWAYAQEEVSLHRRNSLVNCTWVSHLHFTSGLLVGCKPRKHQSLGRTNPRVCFALRTITIFGILNSSDFAKLRLRWGRLMIVIWLILPVVICLSQRLSHACLSISSLYYETADGSLKQSQSIRWFYYSDNRSNSRANTCTNLTLVVGVFIRSNANRLMPSGES